MQPTVSVVHIDGCRTVRALTAFCIAQWDMSEQEPGEAAPDMALHLLPAQSQPGSSHSHLGSPAATWPAHSSPSREAASQEGHPGHSMRQLPAALTEDQFAQRFAMQPEARPVQLRATGPSRAAQAASTAPSSLSAAEPGAQAAAGGRRLQRMRGGAGDAAAHADFMAFPWGEVMEMSEADPWLPHRARRGR